MPEAATGASPERVLHLTRHYPHPRERVFAAWTQPQRLIRWWGPKGVHIAQHRIDVRTGGAWETTMRNEAGEDFFVSGTYLEITPPVRLVFTWAWRGDAGERGHETTVTVELDEEDGGTRLALTQTLFQSEEARDLHNEGWDSSLERLEEYLVGEGCSD